MTRFRWQLGVLSLLAMSCSGPEPGHLELAVVEAGSGRPTPARVEILDADGRAWVPEAALPLTFQCIAAPPPAWLEWAVTSNRLDNPHTGTTQFYLDATASLELPAGRYTLTASKGIEHRVARQEIEIRPGEEARVSLPVSRWSDLPSRGWYAADGHLHITRLDAEDDARLLRWMQAEDLNVASLLQMGTQQQFSVTPQHGFGDGAVRRSGNTLLVSGQEHPRTHLLGHTITLGAQAAIDLRDRYIVFGETWRESRRLDGASGYAHWGLGAARDGLALDAPMGLLSFLEVLQFDRADYSVWYEVLNLGIRMTPTAGTDFPCGPWSVPGRERFYTRVEGDLDRASWVEGIRRGRTFVTNGPLLELRIGSAGIGDELRLPGPGPVRVEASVRFDPERDDVTDLELVQGGRMLPFETRRVAPGEIQLEATVVVSETSWLALRARGDKRGETPLRRMFPPWVWPVAHRFGSGASLTGREAYVDAHPVRPSAAHTAPIFVTVEGSPPPEAGSPRRRLAREWIARLDDLEARLAEDRIDEQTIWDWAPYSDGVPAEHLRRNREALLAAITEARSRTGQLAEGGRAGGPARR